MTHDVCVGAKGNTNPILTLTDKGAADRIAAAINSDAKHLLHEMRASVRASDRGQEKTEAAPEAVTEPPTPEQ